MRAFLFSRQALGACAVAALLAGCNAHGTSASIPLGFEASRPPAGRPSANCPSKPKGSGILTDGDFSQAPDPGSWQEIPVGTKFAPDWVVSERTIDFYGSDVSWHEPHGLCSVDLDGSGRSGVGAITHAPVKTMVDATYTIDFIMSGNANCARGQGNPRVKRLLVEAVSRNGNVGKVFSWNTAQDHDAQHGDFARVRWHFTALGDKTSFVFQSLDRPDYSNCGPVVAGMSVNVFLRRLRGADLRRPNRFGHTVENHNPLPATSSRERFRGRADTAVDVLPVVHRPDVAGWIDVDVRLHLQTSADVAAGG
jgi:hypothetical protein